jgi:dTDP-4-dehydrorhamnose 3,5-epimerase
MELHPLGIEGVWLVTSPIKEDHRGSFNEWFESEEIFRLTGYRFSVEQANISTSHKNVLRGIHYSLAKKGQAKWISCINGAIQDVVVDIRPSSPTYRKSVLVDLLPNSGQAIFISKDLGHGFLSLLDNSRVAYLLSSQYSPVDEFEINPMDSELNIDWGIPSSEAILSVKDLTAPTLGERFAERKLPGM